MIYCCANCCINNTNFCNLCLSFRTNNKFTTNYMISLKNAKNKLSLKYRDVYTILEIIGLPEKLTHLKYSYDLIFGWDYDNIPCSAMIKNFPPNLIVLDCTYNNIINFNYLPPILKILNCSHNQITNLDNLPQTLKILNCSHNKITNLDNLPLGLTELDCSHNQITNLDNLTNDIIKLNCSCNKIINLDNLPNSLEYLYCDSNPINNYFSLPHNLKVVNDVTYADKDSKNLIIKCLGNYKRYVCKNIK